MIELLKPNRMFCSKIMHQVQPGETAAGIASDYNTSVKNIEAEAETLQAGDCVFITNINQTFYVVKPMDTINSIAEKHGVTTESLKKKNNLNNVFIGQLLNIE
ncbi:MAG: LysM peptidoglycan-binding domain-containing protein [Firmicutes bacterium]|nr:LysM peptidoglycan-binding domain-containing protein [Bacillota bacterium]